MCVNIRAGLPPARKPPLRPRGISCIIQAETNAKEGIRHANGICQSRGGLAARRRGRRARQRRRRRIAHPPRGRAGRAPARAARAVPDRLHLRRLVLLRNAAARRARGDGRNRRRHARPAPAGRVRRSAARGRPAVQLRGRRARRRAPRRRAQDVPAQRRRILRAAPVLLRRLRRAPRPHFRRGPVRSLRPPHDLPLRADAFVPSGRGAVRGRLDARPAVADALPERRDGHRQPH